MDPGVACGEIAAVGSRETPDDRVVVALQAHASPKALSIVRDAFERDVKRRPLGAGLVEQQPHGAAVIGDEHVDVAVVVHVPECGSPAHERWLESRSALASDVPEAFAADVVQEQIALVERIRIAAKHLDDRDGAVGNEEIQQAIVVVIEPVRAESSVRTRRCGEADSEPPVFKPAVATILVECVCLSGDLLHAMGKDADFLIVFVHNMTWLIDNKLSYPYPYKISS